jgi:hypothetical protein
MNAAGDDIDLDRCQNAFVDERLGKVQETVESSV